MMRLSSAMTCCGRDTACVGFSQSQGLQPSGRHGCSPLVVVAVRRPRPPRAHRAGARGGWAPGPAAAHGPASGEQAVGGAPAVPAAARGGCERHALPRPPGRPAPGGPGAGRKRGAACMRVGRAAGRMHRGLRPGQLGRHVCLCAPKDRRGQETANLGRLRRWQHHCECTCTGATWRGGVFMSPPSWPSQAGVQDACQPLCSALQEGAKRGAVHVPLVAVRRAPADAAAAPAWVLLVPAGCVGPVWRALVLAGARAAGLRECAPAGVAARLVSAARCTSQKSHARQPCTLPVRLSAAHSVQECYNRRGIPSSPRTQVAVDGAGSGRRSVPR